MFLGLFIVLASLLTLLENIGVITTNVKWGMPLAFACLGLSIIFENFRKKDNSLDREKFHNTFQKAMNNKGKLVFGN